MPRTDTRGSGRKLATRPRHQTSCVDACSVQWNTLPIEPQTRCGPTPLATNLRGKTRSTLLAIESNMFLFLIHSVQRPKLHDCTFKQQLPKNALPAQGRLYSGCNICQMSGEKSLLNESNVLQLARIIAIPVHVSRHIPLHTVAAHPCRENATKHCNSGQH